jgi:hypothetical protein
MPRNASHSLRRSMNQSKRTLIEMANTWLKLAEQHLKNSETTLVYETPTPLKTSDDDLK